MQLAIGAPSTLAPDDPDVLPALIGPPPPFDPALEEVAAVDETVALVVGVLAGGVHPYISPRGFSDISRAVSPSGT